MTTSEVSPLHEGLKTEVDNKAEDYILFISKADENDSNEDRDSKKEIKDLLETDEEDTIQIKKEFLNYVEKGIKNDKTDNQPKKIKDKIEQLLETDDKSKNEIKDTFHLFKIGLLLFKIGIPMSLKKLTFLKEHPELRNTFVKDKDYQTKNKSLLDAKKIIEEIKLKEYGWPTDGLLNDTTKLLDLADYNEQFLMKYNLM